MKVDLDKIKQECELTTFRSSGPGGQHKNVTDSAVRLKHIPTGITVVGQSHRSQHRNMTDALERLAKRLEERARKPKPRIPTRKSAALKIREKEEKKKRTAVKRQRQKVESE